jgi:hypothetical protein
MAKECTRSYATFVVVASLLLLLLLPAMVCGDPHEQGDGKSDFISIASRTLSDKNHYQASSAWLPHTRKRDLTEYFPVCTLDPITTSCEGLFENIGQQCVDDVKDIINPDASFCYYCGGDSLPEFRTLLVNECFDEYDLTCSLGDIQYSTNDNGDDQEIRATSCCSQRNGRCTTVVEVDTLNCYNDLTFFDGTTTYPTCVLFLATECLPDTAQVLCNNNNNDNNDGDTTPSTPSTPASGPTPSTPTTPGEVTRTSVSASAPLAYKKLSALLLVLLAAASQLCVLTQWA